MSLFHEELDRWLKALLLERERQVVRGLLAKPTVVDPAGWAACHGQPGPK